jgi:hypothetical protein
MAKAQTFADKLMKGQRKSRVICPKCNTEFSFILFVSSEKSKKTGKYKFNQRQARVCKCNEKQFYN